MPTTLQPTAGSTLAVSAAAPATNNVAGYAALTWTPVGGISNLPEMGGAMEVQNFDSLTDGRIKYRGISDPGDYEASMSDMPTDAGQIIMKAAYDAARGSAGETISFRMQNAAGTGTYFRGKVASWRRVPGGVNDVWLRTAMVAIDAGTDKEF